MGDVVWRNFFCDVVNFMTFFGRVEISYERQRKSTSQPGVRNIKVVYEYGIAFRPHRTNGTIVGSGLVGEDGVRVDKGILEGNQYIILGLFEPHFSTPTQGTGSLLGGTNIPAETRAFQVDNMKEKTNDK